jgi:uncharacterized protein
MRVVLDTNVFISGIFWSGVSGKILNQWRDGNIELVISTEIILEIIRVLNDFKIRLPDDLINEWRLSLISNSILVIPKTHVDIVEDKTDNKFIEAAIEGKAEYIISSDKHLLKIGQYKHIRILRPQEFIKLL